MYTIIYSKKKKKKKKKKEKKKKKKKIFRSVMHIYQKNSSTYVCMLLT